jgi:iron complex transport system substrate-binding protein
LAAAAALVALSVSACSTGPAGGSSAAPSAGAVEEGAFPVTIEHAFGEITIEEQPERVATVSWVNADVSLALGVVPVGMPKEEWGGNENLSTPWFDAALAEAGATEEATGEGSGPEAAGITMYSEADGINFDAVAQTTPDVILAAYSGLTQEDYDKLSKIAPVVAYPEVAYGTPWQDTTAMIGEALGKSGEAQELVAGTGELIEAEAVSRTRCWARLRPSRTAHWLPIQTTR